MATQPKFFEMPNPFNLSLWRSFGRRLFEQDELMQWEIGDWLLEAEEIGELRSKELMKEACKISRRSWGTLKNYKSLSKQFPKEPKDGSPSLRSDAIGYNVYRVVAPFSPEDRGILLAKAAKVAEDTGDPMTVDHIKHHIQLEQGAGRLPKKPKKEKALKEESSFARRTATIKVKFTKLHAMFLDEVGVADGKAGECDDAELIHSIVCQWVSDNLDSLLNAHASHKDYYGNPIPSRWATLKPEARRVLAEFPDRRTKEEFPVRKIDVVRKESSPDPVSTPIPAVPATSSTSIRVAASLPKQRWIQSEKLAWLDKAIAENPCDLFLTPQEFVGGGSTREWCRLKGFETDDVPVTDAWLLEHVGSLCRKHNVHIGFGATVSRNGRNSEDFLYFNPQGQILGYHSKIALPVQDSIITNGASQVTPEVDYKRAVTPIKIPALGLCIGTVFCWQVFFVDMWRDYMRAEVNLCVHPIKFAPRAWYKKGLNPDGKPTRIGFTQNKVSENPEDDSLGWIRKLRYESEFKQVPIAVTCNTWDGGSKYLALVGWVDEVTHKTNLVNLPSTAETEKVVVTEYDPALFDALPTFHRGLYGQYKAEYGSIMEKTMMRKALRIEKRAQDRQLAEKLAKTLARSNFLH